MFRPVVPPVSISFIVLFCCSLTLIIPATSQATPIVAKAVVVEGKVTRTPQSGGSPKSIVVGDTFFAGDIIKTSRNGIVEIKFDTGSLILIDSNTRMTIKSLEREKDGTTRSIFGLLFGRIKSSVTKLATKFSKFEYHTKAAICGVAGTPPFVVEYQRGQQQANIDLLGKAGQEGAVFVQGFDNAKTRVSVLPGQQSSVRLGRSPLPPRRISPARFRSLTRGMPFRTSPELNDKAEGKSAGLSSSPQTEESGDDDDDSGNSDDTTDNSTTDSEQGDADDDNDVDPAESDEPGETTTEQPADGSGNESTPDPVASDPPPADSPATGDASLSVRIGSSATPITTSITRDAAFQTVSTTIKPSPEAASSIQSTSSQSSTQQGTVGEAVGGGVDLPPAVARGRFEVIFR